MFATVAIAALFASCSSSDDFVAPKTAAEDVPSGEGLVPIQIGVGSNINVSTRGTGTIGSIGNGQQNFWYGQKIKVFMTKKDDSYNTTMILAKNNNESLYENAEMITPGTSENLVDDPAFKTPQTTGEAMLTDKTIKYYPINGNFDFFGYAYHEGCTGIPALNDAEDAYEASITIDGSQDLMSTKAKLDDSQLATMNSFGEDNKNRYYSAYAARDPRNIQPNLVFDHLLTRLQFNVKAGNATTAGVEECYQLIADPSKTISKSTYDKLSQEDFVIGKYVESANPTNEKTVDEYREITDPAVQALYEARYTADGGKTFITKDYYENELAFATIAEKEAAYTLVVTQVDPQDEGYTGVKVEKIEVFSKKTGTMLVAWKAANPQRLIWDAASEATTGWLSLQQRNPEAPVVGYIKNDRSEFKTEAEWASEPPAKPTEWRKYYNPNTALVALTPVAPGYNKDGATDVDKFYYTPVGEALLVSTPVASNGLADAQDYEMRITLSQKVKTQWGIESVGPYPMDPVVKTIPAPEGGFKTNTSYNINLVLYGTEKIDILTTIVPWQAGEEIPPIDID